MFRTLLLLAALSLPTAVYAQTSQDGRLPSAPPDPNRAAGEKACSGDAREFCRNVLSQGDMAVLACFQQNRTNISRECDAFLRKNGQ
jgi:hypothetical protein